MEIMLTAERRLCHQDPKVTLAKQLRASELSSASATPILHLSPPRIAPPPSSAPPTVPRSTLGSTGNIPSPPDPIIPTPPGTEIELTPEFQALRALFFREPPLVNRFTKELNGHTYYVLPDDFPRLSRPFCKLLGTRCTNCGDADALFPSHGWKNCPFFTPPHRTSLWPEHHSPIFSIAEGGKVRKSAHASSDPPKALSDLSSQLRTMNSYHAKFVSEQAAPYNPIPIIF